MTFLAEIKIARQLMRNFLEIRARICKRLRRPGIDYEEPIPPGWDSIPGLFKRFKIPASDRRLLSNHWNHPAWQQTGKCRIPLAADRKVQNTPGS
jgi:hypothetical protein